MNDYSDVTDERGRLSGAIFDEVIRDLDPGQPVCVTAETTLAVAVERMNAVKAGCALVTRDGKLDGILTERDVLRHVAQEQSLSTPVAAAMTNSPQSLGLDDGIAFALQRMHQGGYRHIPIVDDDGRPVAVVTVRDVMRYIVSLFPARVLNIPPEPRLGIARSIDGA